MSFGLVRNVTWVGTKCHLGWYEMSFGSVRNDLSVYKMDRDLVRNDLVRNVIWVGTK